MNYLVESANHTLYQLKSFLKQVSLEEYTNPLPILSDSTLGMHVRHIIEFYQCIVKGYLNGEMDYDARERSLLQESSIDYACSCIENLLIDFTMFEVDKSILLKTEQNMNEHTCTIKTSLSRELSYVIEHTIHHLAIVKMGCIAAYQHIQFDKDFGVAYSTIKYRERVHSDLSA
jgi:uncharacterized damage-inducible protein DinB